MLYNQDWDKPKTTFGTVADLIAWLEKQPADTRYNWADGRDCLICRYAGKAYLPSIVAMDKANPGLNYGEIVYIAKGRSHLDALPDEYGHWTYGDALKRARRLVSATV